MNVKIHDSSITGANNLGGMCYENRGNIKNCSVTESTISGKASTGGLVSYAYDGSLISESYSLGPVDGKYHVGGLVAIGHGHILNCYSHSPTTSTTTDSRYGTGSLVGRAYSRSRIDYSYGTGLVSANNKLGGLIGICDSGSKVVKSCWDRFTTGQYQDCSNAISLFTGPMQHEETYSGWDFDNVWAIDEGESYPYLKSQQ